MNDAGPGKRARSILFIGIFAAIIIAVIVVILVVYPPDRIESVALDDPAVIDFYLAHLEYDEIVAERVSSSHVKFSAINGTTSAHLNYKTVALGTEITYQCEEDGEIVYDGDLPTMCFGTDVQ